MTSWGGPDPHQFGPGDTGGSGNQPPYDPYSSAPLPSQSPFPQLGEPPLIVIGDITCTQSQVFTPTGSFPIAGTQWSVTDMSTTREQMSQTGLILAIVGLFLVCVLSLFFLLMKDRVTTGFIQVTVRSADGRVHVTNIPARSQASGYEVNNMVNYARSVAASASF